jgi:hypothetical protein
MYIIMEFSKKWEAFLGMGVGRWDAGKCCYLIRVFQANLLTEGSCKHETIMRSR